MPRAKQLHTSKPTRSDSKPLYASQTTIPHLPVPTLSSTFAKYIETLQPLQTKEKHAESKAIIDKFLKSDQSKTLQSRLEQRAKERDSWLSEWWNDAAYMGFRGRIIPNVSYFYVHKKGSGNGQSQEDRAAELVRATVEFKKLVDRCVFERALSHRASGDQLLMQFTASDWSRRRAKPDRSVWPRTSTCKLAHYGLQSGD